MEIYVAYFFGRLRLVSVAQLGVNKFAPAAVKCEPLSDH